MITYYKIEVYISVKKKKTFNKIIENIDHKFFRKQYSMNTIHQSITTSNETNQ